MTQDTMLLVDHDASARQNLAEILETLGYGTVVHAESAAVAWRLLKCRPCRCVIAEMQMPEMSGLALLKIIRSDDHLGALPFFLTHDAFTKVKVLQAGQEGATGLLVKPFSPGAVREKLRLMVPRTPSPAIAQVRGTLAQGLHLMEQNAFEEALAVFERLVTEGESAEIYYNIGYIKTAQEKYNEAIAAFQKATELDRLFGKAYAAMGRIYRKLGRAGEAERCLQKAADIYLTREKMEDAEEILNQILEIRPDTVNVYNSLGVLYRKKGKFQRALDAYQKALRIHADQPQIHYNMGRLWLEMKDVQAAAGAFEKALQLNPAFKEAQDVLEAIRLGKV